MAKPLGLELQNVPVLEGVRMSRMLSRAALALASDGRLVMNLACFDLQLDAQLLLERGLVERGVCSWACNPSEVAVACSRLSHGFAEAAAFAAGMRQRLARQRR
jgi:hypothetical protein